jgi:hypothetical protein
MKLTKCNNCGLDSESIKFPCIPITLNDSGFVEIDTKQIPFEVEKQLREKHFCSPKCLVEWIPKQAIYK